MKTPEEIYSEWKDESHPDVVFVEDNLGGCKECIFSKIPEDEEICRLPCMNFQRKDGKTGHYVYRHYKQTDDIGGEL